MALKKIKLGDYLIPYKEKCGIPDLTPYDISGVNKDKEFFEPSRQTGEDTTNYQNVPPGYFACNLMHVGRDKVLPIAYNHTQKVKHVSPAYSIFRIKENEDLLDYYFFIYLKSDERDRFFWFNTDASVRDGMTWEDLCNVELNVPPLPVQQKYVDVYNAMLANQKSYERGLGDLNTACIAAIEKLKSTEEKKSILLYLIERQEINAANKYDDLIGVGNEGFIIPRGSRDSDSFHKCNIFYPKDFVYNPSVVSKGAIAFNNKFSEPKICTEEYIVFFVNDENLLSPEYLFLWLKRKETGRYLEFVNMDSVRNRVYFRDLDKISIPIPNIKVQRSIAELYNAYYERKEINERLKNQIKDICPILIKGSIEEARKEV